MIRKTTVPRRRISRVGKALNCAALLVAASLAPSNARAQQDSLYIGYHLPTNPDLAADARRLESQHLNERIFADQACRSDAGCLADAEIAFRRAISSIQGTEFKLARCPRNNCKSVDDFLTLSASDAVDGKLNDVFREISFEGRYSATGLYADLTNGGCTVRRKDDNVAVDFARSGLEESICEGLQTWYNDRFDDAVTHGDLDRVKSLIDTGYVVGCSIEEPHWGAYLEEIRIRPGFVASKYHATLCAGLAVAAWKGKQEIARLLLDKGATNVDEALLEAVAAAGGGLGEEIVQWLLDRGADPIPAVPLAVAREDVGVLKLLLSRGASLEQAQRWRQAQRWGAAGWRGAASASPLLSIALASGKPKWNSLTHHRDADEGRVEGMVTLLLVSGLRPASGPRDVMDMCIAAARGQARIFQLVFNPNAKWFNANAELSDWDRCTFERDGGDALGPLSTVVAAGNGAQVLESFLKLPVGWSAKAKDEALNEVAHATSHVWDPAVADILIRYGANPNVGLREAAAWAGYSGTLEYMQFFLQHGAHANGEALAAAAGGCAVDAVKFLVQHGARLDKESEAAQLIGLNMKVFYGAHAHGHDCSPGKPDRSRIEKLLNIRVPSDQ